jgi:pilus assembly protein Flp/PilA
LQAKKQKNKNKMEEVKMERIRNFFKDESGATMVEYGIMVAGIAAVCILIVNTLGGQVLNAFTNTSTNMGAGAAGG